MPDDQRQVSLREIEFTGAELEGQTVAIRGVHCYDVTPIVFSGEPYLRLSLQEDYDDLFSNAFAARNRFGQQLIHLAREQTIDVVGTVIQLDSSEHGIIVEEIVTIDESVDEEFTDEEDDEDDAEEEDGEDEDDSDGDDVEDEDVGEGEDRSDDADGIGDAESASGAERTRANKPDNVDSERDITELIERMEAAEQRCKVRLSALSAFESRSPRLAVTVRGELCSISGGRVRYDLTLVVALYCNGRVVGTDRHYIRSGEFDGFEAFEMEVPASGTQGITGVKMFPQRG